MVKQTGYTAPTEYDLDRKSRPLASLGVSVSGYFELNLLKKLMLDVENGHLAMKYCGLWLVIQVCETGAGFYIGTQDENGPVSRESVEYFDSEEQALNAVQHGSWTQRQEP